jgi:hypothetical protein
METKFVPTALATTSSPRAKPRAKLAVFSVAFMALATLVASGCATEVDGSDGNGAADAPDQEVSATEDALTGQQACTLVAGASAGLGALATTAFFGTAGCAGAMAVTGPGELVCLAPASGATLAGIGAVLTGGASYLLCSTTAGPQRIPLTTTGSTTCATTSATDARDFCRNLYKRYKQPCESLDLNFPDRSTNSCSGISIATARDQSTCSTLNNRLEKNAQCLHGRRMMQDFIRRGICQGDATDPTGAGHAKPIQVANNLLAECKSKLSKLSNLCGLDAEAQQRATIRRFNQAVYTCR